MPHALLLVKSPVIHPIAARPGDLLAWYPTKGINVMREKHGQWHMVRSLPFDNAGALGVLLCDETVTPFSEQDAAIVRPLVQEAVRRRLQTLQPFAPVSRAYRDTPQRSA